MLATVSTGGERADDEVAQNVSEMGQIRQQREGIVILNMSTIHLFLESVIVDLCCCLAPEESV